MLVFESTLSFANFQRPDLVTCADLNCPPRLSSGLTRAPIEWVISTDHTNEFLVVKLLHLYMAYREFYGTLRNIINYISTLNILVWLTDFGIRNEKHNGISWCNWASSLLLLLLLSSSPLFHPLPNDIEGKVCSVVARIFFDSGKSCKNSCWTLFIRVIGWWTRWVPRPLFLLLVLGCPSRKDIDFLKEKRKRECCATHSFHVQAAVKWRLRPVILPRPNFL